MRPLLRRIHTAPASARRTSHNRISPIHVPPTGPVAARFIIRAYDGLAALLFALLLLGATPHLALAYVDPSVMTYTIQAIAGAAVALGAVLGVALRRTRRWLFRILRIDENAHKIVDPAVVALDGDSAASVDARAAANNQARAIRGTLENGKPVRTLTWGTRFIRALIGCAFLIATVFIFAPLELVAAGAESLMFDFFDVIGLVITTGVVLIIICALLVSLIRGKAFDIVLTVIVSLGLGCYIQALALNFSLPVADGNAFHLADHLVITIVSTLVWAALIVVMLLFNAKKRAYCRAFVVTVSVLLLCVQGLSMIGVTNDASAKLDVAKKSLVMSTYGINEVGRDANVTVFVLDTYDTKMLDEVFATDPSLRDDFNGFTYFRNSTGELIPTGNALLFLLTNTRLEPGEAFNDYRYSVFDRSSFLADIVANGYEATVYTDSVDRAKIEPYAANVYPADGRSFDQVNLWLSLEKMALFRDAPWVLKPAFWFYTDEINATLTDSYFIDDYFYARNLREQGLSVSQSADKTFRFIHLLGSHYPFTLDREGHKVPESETNRLDQSIGCLTYVIDYLRQLKELGLYDQSTIIITADHGDWYLTDQPLDTPASPCLLVKPSQTAAEAAAPLAVSEVPTGHLDFPATVIDAVGGDPKPYGTPVFDVTDGPRDRYYWETLSNGHRNFKLLRYKINGDVLDINSWHLTGESIDIPE